MKCCSIEKAASFLGEVVRLDGFAESIRDTKYMQFLVLRDLSGRIQLTLEKNELNHEWNQLVSSLTPESTLQVEGRIMENPKVKLGGVECLPSSIKVTSRSSETLPLDLRNLEKASLENRLNYRFLDLRSEKNQLLFQVQTCMVQAMRDCLLQKRFIEIHTPKLIAAASESGSEVFEVDYFERKAYLAQSPQFYKQMCIAGGLERVFEIAPAFRAEKSNSYRHATEFTSFDLEFSGIESYEEVMNLEEEILVSALSRVKEEYGERIQKLFGTEVIVPARPFPRIKLAQLMEILRKDDGLTLSGSEIGDMNAETERLASRYIMEEYGHEFVFVTDFSAAKRAFYHMRKDGVPQGYDLIWRGCEITTGAQREHRYEILKEQAREKGLGEDVQFYLEFFRYGCPPHGGFGLGIDRLTMLLLQTGSLRETMLLFRGPGRLTP